MRQIFNLKKMGTRLAAVTMLAGSVLVATVGADPGVALAGSCTNSSVKHVWTEQWSGGQRQIRIIPTTAARMWQFSTATNNIWAAVQQCVPGLYGSVADSVYSQIRCHALGAQYGYWWAGGYSWDVETWRAPYQSNWTMLTSKCNWGGDGGYYKR